MSLSDIQWEFLRDVARLIFFAEENGYKLAGKELQRDILTQKRYLKLGKTKTLNSDHLDGLAIDFAIFKDTDGDGDKDYTATVKNPVDVCRSLGDYWKSLNPRNYWGGDWGWDTPHFGRKR